MQRRTFVTAAAVSAVFGILGSPAIAQTKWNLAAAYANTNFHTENLQEFAKDVERLSGGKLSITVHGNASLFKAPEIKRAAVSYTHLEPTRPY